MRPPPPRPHYLQLLFHQSILCITVAGLPQTIPLLLEGGDVGDELFLPLLEEDLLRQGERVGGGGARERGGVMGRGSMSPSSCASS